MLPTIVSAIATGSALVAGLFLDARIILDSFTVTYLFIYLFLNLFTPWEILNKIL